MDLKELFYVLREYHGGTYESLEEIKSLASDIRGRPEAVVSELEDILEEEALEHGLCPLCLATVERGISLNETVDYMGADTNESLEELICPDCGWSNKD